MWPTVEVGKKITVPFSADDVRLNDDAIVLETISMVPRIFRIHNFVSEEETDSLIARANSLKLERSTGGLIKKSGAKGTANQGDHISDRTSTNAWDQNSALAIKIKKRAFDLLRMEFKDDWCDGLQMVRYEPPQWYNSHQDWFNVGASPNWNWDPATGGVNRFATVFLYLNDVELGGETVFPRSTQKLEPNTYRQEDFDRLAAELMPVNSTQWKLANQCRTGMRVSPRKGDAILFYNQRPAGGTEFNALHGACPLIEGIKWGANLWVWNGQAWSPHREKGYMDEEKPHPLARSVIFYNDMPNTLASYWEKAPGEDTFLGNVNAGGNYPSNTYVGHTFIFKLEDKTEVSRYTITEEKEQQVFRIPGGKQRPHSEL